MVPARLPCTISGASTADRSGHSGSEETSRGTMFSRSSRVLSSTLESRCAQRNDANMSTTTKFTSYEEALAQHRWVVPERYNIAADTCDRHPRDKLAMIHEDFRGNVRRVSWGELQDASNRFANVLVAHGVQRGDRVAMLLPPTPETAAAFFGTWKVGAILLSMSVLYGDEGIRHRLSDSQSKVLVTNADNVDRIERSLVEHLLVLDDELLGKGSAAFLCVDAAADDPAQLYYSSGTTGLAKGILHAHATRPPTERSSTVTTPPAAGRSPGWGEWP